MRLHVLLAFLATATIWLAGGCASSHDAPSYTTGQEEDGDWLTGADRLPTQQTLYATAKILVDQGKDAQAQAMLEQVIRERPTFAPGYVDLAEIHQRRRDVNAAIEVLRSGLRACPRDAVMLNDIGMCLMSRGDYDGALPMFKQAVAVETGNTRYRSNMATALGLLGRYDESLALYEQVLPIGDAHYNLAVLCEARKDFERAALEFALASKFSDASGRSATQPAAPAAFHENRRAVKTGSPQ